MIDRNHALPVIRQARALGVSRSSVYDIPQPVPAEDLNLVRRLDEMYLDHPCAGARMLWDLLRRDGVAVGRRHVSTLMKRMGIEAIYRQPNTSKPAPGHKIYPYLLRGVTIDQPNQVWAKDISLHADAARLRLSRGGCRYVCAARSVASRADHDGS